jgi:hypothetical protein
MKMKKKPKLNSMKSEKKKKKKIFLSLDFSILQTNSIQT